jgi:hypothetical protein
MCAPQDDKFKMIRIKAQAQDGQFRYWVSNYASGQSEKGVAVTRLFADEVDPTNS